MKANDSQGKCPSWSAHTSKKDLFATSGRAIKQIRGTVSHLTKKRGFRAFTSSGYFFEHTHHERQEHPEQKSSREV